MSSLFPLSCSCRGALQRVPSLPFCLLSCRSASGATAHRESLRRASESIEVSSPSGKHRHPLALSLAAICTRRATQILRGLIPTSIQEPAKFFGCRTFRISPTSPLFATHPETASHKSFACCTSETPGGPQALCQVLSLFHGTRNTGRGFTRGR